MKDIEQKLESLNTTIESLQKEADLYLVIHFFDKIKEFQQHLKKETDNTDINITVGNTLDFTCWLHYDHSIKEMIDAFTIVEMKLAKNWQNIQSYINFDLTITESTTLEEFIRTNTTKNYQREYLSLKLGEILDEKPHHCHMKI